MNIIMSKNAGFCFGVERAVSSVYENIKKYNMPIYTYGEIIHNSQVVDDLACKGVKVINNIQDISQINEGVIIIRSHGVSPNVYESIEKNKLLSIDMTCPYVKKVHKLVKEHYENGYQIIIIGEESHDEAVGINGYCSNSAIIINCIEDAYNIEKQDKICIVAQTTLSIEKWEQIKNFIIFNKCKEYVEFNTICSTTNERQKETLDIAKKVDVMITIGGKNSSNTGKLHSICLENCKKCYMIETVDELDLQEIAQYDNIGVSAGASTPKWIIDEVMDALKSIDNLDEVQIEESHGIDQLNNNETEEVEDFDFSKELDNSFKKISIGDTVDGEIVAIDDDEVIVNFGYKSDGFMSIAEFNDDIKIGDKIKAVVIERNSEGTLVLSKKQIDIEKAWVKAKDAYDSNAIILVKVLEQIKGGMSGSYEGLRVFIPMSQLSNKYIEDTKEFLKTTIPVKIIEFDEDNTNVVVSSRIVLEESAAASKRDFWSGLHIGKEFVGTVSNLLNYGAFIDIGGVQGLLHISEISHNKSDTIESLLNIGDSIQVYIKNIDNVSGKISLALKNRPESPWTGIDKRFKEGDIIGGTVTKLMTYGAFVEIVEGIDGLVHISQISDKNLNKPDEVLSIGQKVKIKILSIDLINRRISLSIKDVAPINEKGESNLEIDESQHSYVEEFDVTLGDLFKNFKF